MELATVIEEIKVKVETKKCFNCNHGYEDHFTDSPKYPKSRKCVYGCGMSLCCYGGCKCGLYIPIVKYIPYRAKHQCYYCNWNEESTKDEFIEHLNTCGTIERQRDKAECPRDPRTYWGNII